MSLQVAVKTCARCGAEKPLSEFSRERARRDGLRRQCKPCDSETAREWQAAERERMGDEAWRAYIADNVRRTRRNNPERRVRDRLISQAYGAAQKRLRHNHPDEFAAIYAQERYERGLT